MNAIVLALFFVLLVGCSAPRKELPCWMTEDCPEEAPALASVHK